jgi:hypothetical protein
MVATGANRGAGGSVGSGFDFGHNGGNPDNGAGVS